MCELTSKVTARCPYSVIKSVSICDFPKNINPIVTSVFKLTVFLNSFLLAGKPHRLDIFQQSVIFVG